MTLQAIRISNIKGIAASTFNLNIIPNRPSLLYAPNGFGKSSVAAAFASLTNARVVLHKDNLHEHDDNNLPELEITIQRADGSIGVLLANEIANAISPEIDCFTIMGQVKAKTTKMKFGGRTNHIASLAVDSINLIDRIPPKQALNYSIVDNRHAFGRNGKILPNLTNAFENIAFVKVLKEQIMVLDRIGGVRIQNRLNEFKQRLNGQHGSSEVLLNWIEANEIAGLDSIPPLQHLTDLLMPLDLGYAFRSQRILAILQIYELYAQNKIGFKSWCERKLYDFEKESYNTSFKAFNSTWRDIRPKEKEGKLLLEFPKANHISNGQRDILCLVGLLEQAKRKLQKPCAILIIDEVFDYLDEANLVAAQYYITEFINVFKKEGRRIYPLILTHLNPGLFKNYSFSKMKVYYLDQRTPNASQSFIRLLQNRDDATIKNDVSQYLFHFHTGQINRRAEFQALGLRATWGEGVHFKNYVDGHAQTYLNNQPGYDPFAVCCAIRRYIEEVVYNQIVGPAEKNSFLAQHMTNNKLLYAESLGIAIPEYYYLLGIIYNDGMHWKPDRDNFSPLAAKLENGTIRKLISDLLG